MHDIPYETIMRAASGDMQAFEQVYKTSCGFVYSVALRVIGNATEAEDVVQEVFVKLYHSLKKFEFRSSLKTWLYRIAVNTALNALKRTKRHMQHRADFQTVLHTNAAIPSDTMHTQYDQEQLIVSLLAKLNPEQRVCIILREIEGLSYQEIAEAMRVNINTVRSRLKRARQALLNLAQREVIYNEL